jgi:hypothetical protein
MSTKTRLTKLEAINRQMHPAREPVQIITVVHTGPGTDDPDGTMLAAAESKAGPKDVLLVVRYDDYEPNRELS